jgi:hypothetical protein
MTKWTTLKYISKLTNVQSRVSKHAPKCWTKQTNKQTDLPSPFLVCNYSSLTTLNYFINNVSFTKNVNTRYWIQYLLKTKIFKQIMYLSHFLAYMRCLHWIAKCKLEVISCKQKLDVIPQLWLDNWQFQIWFSIILTVWRDRYAKYTFCIVYLL